MTGRSPYPIIVECLYALVMLSSVRSSGYGLGGSECINVINSGSSIEGGSESGCMIWSNLVPPGFYGATRTSRGFLGKFGAYFFFNSYPILDPLIKLVGGIFDTRRDKCVLGSSVASRIHRANIYCAYLLLSLYRFPRGALWLARIMK